MQLNTTRMLAEKADGIGWMTFNNPERHNAINLEMQQAIPVILEDFAADPEVRVVVLRGAGGKSFVSGADISEFESRRSNPEAIAEYSAIAGRANAAYRALGKPLIAMIQGFCLGGGLLTALKADLRIASDNSRFGIPAVRLAVGYTYENVKAVADVVGAAHARDILLTGRHLDAQTAYRMGLIHDVVSVDDLEQTVKGVARTIAGNAPLTIRAIRAALDEWGKDAADRDLDGVAQLVEACSASNDYIEGRRAFMEKRRPQFTGS